MQPNMPIGINGMLYFLLMVLSLLLDIGNGALLDKGTLLSVETLVIVDRKAYKQWYDVQMENTNTTRHKLTELAIRQFVSSVFAGVNLVFGSMRTQGVNLDVRIRDIQIIMDEEITPSADSRTDILQGTQALSDFSRWHTRKNFSHNDHTLLLTGFSVAEGWNVNAEGVAYKNAVCTAKSLSILENSMNSNIVLTIAHELGHSLGANHDGEDNSCSSTSGYIMAPVRSGGTPLRWIYSPCSLSSIRKLIESLKREEDCLSNTTAPKVDAPYLGRLYDADTLCQLSFGSQSYVCRSLYHGAQDYAQLCQYLRCASHNDTCTTIIGADGLDCGRGKRCLAGKCTASYDVASIAVSDSCPLGDTPQKVSGNSTCRDVILASTHNCLTPYFKDACCNSCEAIYTGNSDCPYGDATTTCKQFHCMLGSAVQCCATCAR